MSVRAGSTLRWLAALGTLAGCRGEAASSATAAPAESALPAPSASLASAAPTASASSGAAPGRDWPAAKAPVTVELSAHVVRDRLVVAGAAAPPNPVSHAATPAHLDRSVVLRFRQNAPSPVPVRAVLVVWPGFFGGAGSLEPLATAVVERGHASGVPVEVWAIDRRANGLEDRRGLVAAEAARDPEIARGYYLGADRVGGQPFAGHVEPAAASYASEWGLAVHLEDVRRLVREALPSAELRRAHVFLAGHSLGGWMTEAYGAFRFADGTRGAEELAGLAMLDGILDGDPVTEAEHAGGFFGPGLPLAGLAATRAGAPLIRWTERFGPWAELLALRARFAPDAVVADAERDRALGRELDLPPERVPRMTNAAALGFFYDRGFQPNFAIALDLGTATGGRIEHHEGESPFGPVDVARPSEPGATFTWVDGPASSPRERSSMATLATAFTRGGVNGVEWYFPNRLVLDIYAARGNAVPRDGWQLRHGIAATEGPQNDAPFLCIASTGTAEMYDELRARLAPAVGPGRPHAGAPRQTDAAFRVVYAPMAHAEVTLAPDAVDNPIPAAVVAFLAAHAAPERVAVRLEAVAGGE